VSHFEIGVRRIVHHFFGKIGADPDFPEEMVNDTSDPNFKVRHYV